MEGSAETAAPDRVRHRRDEWIEVDAKSGDNEIAVEPFVLRPGADDDLVCVAQQWSGYAVTVRIADLRAALDKIEEMSR